MVLGVELTDSLVYTLGTAGMAVGVVVAARGLAGTRERVVTGQHAKLLYGLLAWTCGIATLSYLGMALGIGGGTFAGHYVETLRYVDWALTTPVLVAEIGILAGARRRTVIAAALADFLMIAVGYGASLASGPLKWGGFLVSSGFFVVLAYYLFVPFGRTAAERGFQRQALFEKVRNLTGVLWLLYPLVWLVGPSALGTMDVTTTAAVVTYLDVTAKTGYTIMVAGAQGMFDGVLGREGTTTAATGD
jgi:sensory rhodopsin